MRGRAWTLLLALVTIVGALAWAGAGQTAPARALRDLTAVLGTLPNGARLAGAPPGQVPPGARSLDRWPDPALRTVAAIAGRGAPRDRVRLAAAVDLYRGKAGEAVSRLDLALRNFPADARVLNDLAAARIVLAGDAGPAALDLSRALDLAERATELRPRWPEPRANRQAALEALGIASAFTAAAPEPAPVTVEAVLHLDAAGCTRLAAGRAQSVRELLETSLPERWAKNFLAERTHDHYLAAMECLASARAAAFDDRLYVESVAAIRAGTPSLRRTIARSYLAYAAGRRLYDAGSREDAMSAFANAQQGFERAASPFAHEAALQFAIGLYQLRRVDAALDRAQTLREIAAARGYPGIVARSNWIAGLALMQRGRIEESVSAQDRAQATYERIREAENVASVANSAADTLRVSGDLGRGWALLTAAAKRFPAVGSLQRRYLLLFNLSLYAQDEGLWRSAEAYQGAALAVADRRAQILTMVEARLRRAQLRVRRRAQAAAEADLRDALQLLPRVTSEASRAYLEAWHDRLRAELLCLSDPRAASFAFEALVPRFRSIEPAEIAPVYLQAGRAARAAGEPARAIGLLRQGIAVAAERRALLSADEYRITQFATSWDLYHDLIDLEVDRDPMAALLIADTARAELAGRSAGEVRPTRGFPPLPESAGDALLYYAALRDRVVVWVIGRDGTTAKSLPYGAEALAADVGALRTAIGAADQAAAAPLSRELYRRLLAPALALAPQAQRLVIAADGPLGDLPFATLIDPSGRFAIEEYEIAYVPVLALLQRRQRRPAGSVLAVGYDGVAAAGGPRLEYAEREAAAIAEAYPSRTVLIGPAAAPSAVARAAGEHDVVHIAAHAQANRFAPWLSFLRLAPEPPADGGGLVRFGEAAQWRLRDGSLVVLSACDTSAGSAIRTFGTVNLAGPFLSAGAGAVAGTLWRIDDRASSAFTPVFHRFVTGGLPPSAALRAAQLAALRSADPDVSATRVWGAWVLQAREISDRR